MAGASLLSRQAERFGAVQPGEEKAVELLMVFQRWPTKMLQMDSLLGTVMK